MKEAKTADSEVAFDANKKKVAEAKTADREVACDSNKYTVNDNFWYIEREYQDNGIYSRFGGYR